MRLVAAVAIAVSLSASVARAQPVTPTWPIPAAASLMRGRVVYALSTDRLTVTAVDVVANEVLWSSTFQQVANGGHEMAWLPSNRLLVHAGGTLATFEPDDGTIVAKYDGPHNGAGWGGRAYLWSEQGVCAIQSQCLVQIIDCRDARPIGHGIRGIPVHRARADGMGDDVGCWASTSRSSAATARTSR